MESLKEGLHKPKHDKHKTDVFVIGIIMIEIATLLDLNPCFDYDHGWFHSKVAFEKLQVVKDLYHDKLFYILKDMI